MATLSHSSSWSRLRDGENPTSNTDTVASTQGLASATGDANTTDSSTLLSSSSSRSSFPSYSTFASKGVLSPPSEPPAQTARESLGSSSSDFADYNDPRTEHNAPYLSLWRLFLIFLWMGCRAWGGPSAQIAMMKEELVTDGKWITTQQFKRVFAVYQVLPGPEATELCCYFGLLSRGRIGAVIAGAAFVLPGFVLVLLLSWLYVTFGLMNPYILASFNAIQAAVAAMVVRAVHKLADGAFLHDGAFSYELFAIGVFAAMQGALDVNFFFTLAFSGLVYVLIRRAHHQPWFWAVVAVFTALYITAIVLSIIYLGATSLGIGQGFIAGQSYWELFLLGLIAGLVTVRRRCYPINLTLSFTLVHSLIRNRHSLAVPTRPSRSSNEKPSLSAVGSPTPSSSMASLSRRSCRRRS